MAVPDVQTALHIFPKDVHLGFLTGLDPWPLRRRDVCNMMALYRWSHSTCLDHQAAILLASAVWIFMALEIQISELLRV